MKFLLLLWSLLAAFVAADDLPCGSYTCPEPKALINADCTGFKVRKESAWDDFAVFQNGKCVMAEDADDPYDFNSNFLCCAENEDDCCEDYPTGFYVGFGIGVGGIALMVLYAVYLCFGSKPAPKVEG